jgi:hypothetical protein
MMRGLYAYATQTLQYCDIHYNFLVDRFGQIFEGRYGGIAAAVHGAHAVGFNTDTTGIAAMGDFQANPAPPAMVNAIERLIAWKFDVHGVNPTTPVAYTTFGNDKFPAGTTITVPRIIGHQDTWFTDCPGQYLEALLPQMRAAVTSLMADHRAWGSWSPPGTGGSVTSAPAVASWATNRLDLFAVDSGTVVHKWSDGLSWSPGWEQLGAPSSAITGAPAAISWGPDRVDIFVTAADHTLRHRWWNGTGWSGWENLGGNLDSAPVVSSWASNRLDVFARATGGALQHSWWNGTAWSGWESLGGVTVGDPAAVSWGFNRVDVFVRGTDNQTWHRWWDGRAWQAWESLGGILTEAPTAASWQPNHLDVFVRGTDNGMYHTWWDGSHWQRFEALGGTLTSKPAAISKSWNRVDAFVRGTDGRIWQKVWG